MPVLELGTTVIRVVMKVTALFFVVALALVAAITR